MYNYPIYKLNCSSLCRIIDKKLCPKIIILAIQPDTTAQGTSGKNEAKLMLARAERLEKKMLVLKERAYELDPELKPKKGRPKKTSEEA